MQERTSSEPKEVHVEQRDKGHVGGAHGVGQTVTSDLEGFGFSHMVLEVGDLDGSERWYRDVVGLDVVGRGLMAEERPHSVLRMNSGQLLVLLEVEHPEPR